MGLSQQAFAEIRINPLPDDHLYINESDPDINSDEKSATDDVIINQHDGLFMLDYQDIRLPKNERIDLIGYHLLTPINDWAYFGVGGYAPFLQGEYGGFMAFGGLLHAQTNISENIFVNSGFSFGGGGGGKSIDHSKEFSGTGGYMRGYLGLGYEFNHFSIGANISHMAFLKSEINNSQLNVFVEIPFSYTTSLYGKAGEFFSSSKQLKGSDDEHMLSLGLDNYEQIDPIGSHKGMISVADFQYSSFISRQHYWYYSAAVGYRGIPIYNQIIVGMGGRIAFSNRVQLYGQLGIGSGGYAPELIDTGSGLLLYPKLSIEYLFNDSLGLSATSGYLYAVDGTSRNYTFGVALNHHFGTSRVKNSTAPQQGQYEGYRIKLSHETLTNLTFKNEPLANLNMLTFQADKLLTKHIYLPIRIAVSYQAYKGFPGYGEMSAGIGLQTRYNKGDAFQFFSELQVGANVEGAILRPSIGLDYSFSEDLAFHTSLGFTLGSQAFSSTSIELGLTRRFSLLDF